MPRKRDDDRPAPSRTRKTVSEPAPTSAETAETGKTKTSKAKAVTADKPAAATKTAKATKAKVATEAVVTAPATVEAKPKRATKAATAKAPTEKAATGKAMATKAAAVAGESAAKPKRAKKDVAAPAEAAETTPKRTTRKAGAATDVVAESPVPAKKARKTDTKTDADVAAAKTAEPAPPKTETKPKRAPRTVEPPAEMPDFLEDIDEDPVVKALAAEAGLETPRRAPRERDAARGRFDDRGDRSERGGRDERPRRFEERGDRPRRDWNDVRGNRDRNSVPRDRNREVEPVNRGEERIARVLARAGLCSRREAEEWIEAGRVSVNGEVLTSPALNVTAKDVILVDGEKLPERERTRLWLFHKPAGLVTTTSDPEGRPTIFERMPEDLPRVITVGRLDINTEGLLLLTNDGGLARVLALPATGWLRRYRVRAHGTIDQATLDRLRGGIEVDGIEYGPIEAELDRVQGTNSWLTLSLREGKNREVKNVLGAIGLDVNRLIRVSFGPFQLGELAEGEVEEIKTRVLRDQLGEDLAELAGVEFDRPVFERVGEREERRGRGDRPARLDTRGERPQRDGGRGDRPGRFGDRDGRPSRFGREDDRGGRFGRDRRFEQDGEDDRPRGKSPEHRFGSRARIWRDGEATDAGPLNKARPGFKGDRARSDREDGERSFRRGAPLTDSKGRRVRFERVGSDETPARDRDGGRDDRGFRDRPDRGFKPRGERSFGDRPDRDFKPRGERSSGERSFGDRPDRGFKPRGERSFGDKPDRGFKPRGERSFGDRPDRDFKPRGERSSGERSFGDRPDRGFKPRGERSFGDKPFGKRDGDRPDRGFKPRGERSFGERSFGDRPSGGGKGFGGKRGDRPGGDRPGGGKPFGKGRPPGGGRRER